MRKRALLLVGLALGASLAGCLQDLPLAPTPRASPSAAPVDDAPDAPASGVLRVHYVDVGQGDGVVWELPGGGIVVYDCGPAAASPAENPMSRYLAETLGQPKGATLHALIASHGHLDHVGGCEELLADYRFAHVLDVWYDGFDAPQSYHRFKEKLRAEAAEGATAHTMAQAPGLDGEQVMAPGDALPLPTAASEAGVTARLVSGFVAQDWDHIAEGSLVVRLAFGEDAFCFQGDIEIPQEDELVTRQEDLSCDVYLVGHHGSKYASSPAWLDKMRPRIAVVSFGENTYGHPTREALCRVQDAGARVYATHRLGDVVVTSTGSGLAVAPDAPEVASFCTAGASYWTGVTPPASAPAGEDTQGASGALRVEATLHEPAPCQGTTVQVSVHVADDAGAPVQDARVAATWHYKSGSARMNATTDGLGAASFARNIGRASVGFEVLVEVLALHDGASGQGTASFTPRAC